MISIVYCTMEHNQKHIDHLKKMAGNPNVEIIEYINKGEGLTKFYQKGLEESKYDVVVFCHDDVLIETKNFANKIAKLFEKNKEYGILGVAGTKFMHESGTWWKDRKKMYGKVKHTHQGKTWLSSYSSDLGNNLEEVVVVDGVFFSVHKNRLQEGFDLENKGFHFYEIDFCFRNHLKGVKLGVHTNVRINHMSIGMTNEEWETNRKLFSEKYKDNLPVKIDRKFTGKERFNVLLCSTKIKDILQVARQLKGKKYTVSVCSEPNTNGLKVLERMGIKFCHLGQPPGYKMGDGKWMLKTPNGDVVSEPNKLYRIHEVNFDLVHVKNDNTLFEHISRFYPELPIIKHNMSTESMDNIITEYQKALA